MASGPFAEEAEISILDDPEVNVELVDQGTGFPIRRQAEMVMKFQTDRHGRCVAKNEGGRGDERERLERVPVRGGGKWGGLSEFGIGSSIAAQLYVQVREMRAQKLTAMS